MHTHTPTHINTDTVGPFRGEGKMEGPPTLLVPAHPKLGVATLQGGEIAGSALWKPSVVGLAFHWPGASGGPCCWPGSHLTVHWWAPGGGSRGFIAVEELWEWWLEKLLKVQINLLLLQHPCCNRNRSNSVALPGYWSFKNQCRKNKGACTIHLYVRKRKQGDFMLCPKESLSVVGSQGSCSEAVIFCMPKMFLTGCRRLETSLMKKGMISIPLVFNSVSRWLLIQSRTVARQIVFRRKSF